MNTTSSAPQVIGHKVQAMFGSIAGRYDLTNTVLSFGIHHYWRTRAVGMLPAESRSIILDLCTGTGDFIPLLKKRFGCAVIGGDFCLPMLQCGQHKLAKKGSVALPASWLQSDAMSLPIADNSLDLVTVGFGVRNFEDLSRGLSEITRVLKPGGRLLVLEFGQPKGVLGVLYRFYSHFVMPTIGGWLTKNRAAYTYLPQTAQNFPCGRKFEEYLIEAGLTPVETKQLTGGIAYAYHAVNGSVVMD